MLNSESQQPVADMITTTVPSGQKSNLVREKVSRARIKIGASIQNIKKAKESVQIIRSQLKSLLQLQKNGVFQFKPKIEIEFQRGNFTLKTVSLRRELISALKLRYDVFSREFKGADAPMGVDVDSYDNFYDHLVIIDDKTKKVVGTYRLNSSRFSKTFYSAEEFDLEELLEVDGIKLEMGRACVQKEYRKGSIMALLWRGIAEYMIATDAQMLFGCGSIKTEDPVMSAKLHKYFEQTGRLDVSVRVTPNSKYQMPGLSQAIEELSQRDLTEAELIEIEEFVPALFRSYLKAGATVCGLPAYDKEFHCIDFLVLLKKEQLNSTHGKKYGLG